MSTPHPDATAASPAASPAAEIPASPPVRLAPHTCSPSALAEANAHRRTRHPRWAPWPDAEEAMQAIRSRPAPTPVQMRDWVSHPDERVPITLVQYYAYARAQQKPWQEAAGALYHRAMSEAIAENVHWTPLLDALSQRTIGWPDDARALRRFYVRQADPMFATRAPYRSEKDQVALLQPWIEAQTEWAALAPCLAAFESDYVQESVLEHARCITREAAQAILAHWDSLADDLARNPHLDEATRVDLVTWCLAQMTNPTAKASAKYAAKNALATLARQGLLPREVIARLFGHLDALSQQVAAAGGEPAENADNTENADNAATRRLREAAEFTAQALLDLATALSAEDLVRLLEARQLGTGTVQRVANLPQATPAVWRTALAVAPTTDLREDLARMPAAVMDPVIRADLRQHATVVITRALLPTADAEECRAHVRRLVRTAPETALAVIDGDIGLARRAVHPLDLLPLSTARDQDTRLRAMGALTLLDPDPDVTPEPPPRRAGRVR